MNRGKVVIVAIFVLAFALTGYAWWFQYRQSARVVESWGSETARLIRQSPEVTLWRLRPVADEKAGDSSAPAAESSVEIENQLYEIIESQDVSNVAGLIHIRHLLAEDNYFDWSNERDDCEPKWDYGLQFRDGQGRAVLVFDPQCRLVLATHNQAALRLGPVSRRLADFFQGL